MELETGKSLIPVVLLGDSLVQLMGTNAYADDWYGYANTSIGAPTRVTYNAGVGGDRTDQILARVAADVVARRPAFCVVYGGLNDVYQDVATATITGYLSDIFDEIETAGIPMIVPVLGPRDSATTDQANTHRAVNAWIRANVESGWDAIVCDWSAALSTGDEVTPNVGYLRDVVHFSETGARAAGVVFESALTEMVTRFT